MTRRHLAWRSLTFYWRTNLAVVAGVAVAVAVLAGALLVGHSVRASLRQLLVSRLGATDYAVFANGFFRQKLAAELSAPRAPRLMSYSLIAVEGMVTHATNRRVASRVAIYGIDSEFWKFHRVFLHGEAPAGRTVRMSAALAEELAAAEGDAIVLRLDKPSEIPVESLHGRKEDRVQSIRLIAGKTLPSEELGEFSLRPVQAPLRAIFLARDRLERELNQTGKANVVLVSSQASLEEVEEALAQKVTLEDLGLRVKILATQGQLALESTSMVLSPVLLEAAQKAAANLGLQSYPVLTYLVNSMSAQGRTTPYSLVTAVDFRYLGAAEQFQDTDMILNEWAASDLQVKPGDRIEIEYYVWRNDGRLGVERAQFTVSRIVPVQGAAADRDFAPEYPGITESAAIHDWDPPFPFDLSKIRPRDEDYWDRYRTTPKAFISYSAGRRLWTTRYGDATSLRLIPPAGSDLSDVQRRFSSALLQSLKPAQAGMSVVAVRTEGLQAAEGSTDFGQYFLYFSFFLMVSALLLVGLFFRLNLEQRGWQAGLLRATGYPGRHIAAVFQREGLMLALLGGLLGAFLASGYAGFVLYGLRTWWSDAVSTPLLRFYFSLGAVAGGLLAGLATATAVISWTLRRLQNISPVALLKGFWTEEAASQSTRRTKLVLRITALLGSAQLLLSWFARDDLTGLFFGAGASFLLAALAALRLWLARGVANPDRVWRLGLSNASRHPVRSVSSMALIACATFLIIALTAFRRDGAERDAAQRPGTGGYALVGESVLPLVHHPGTPEGRQELGFSPDSEPLFEKVKVTPLRLRPGEDSSCLNLYQPKNPRVVGLPAEVLARLPKDTLQPGEGIPAYVDANSLRYVLHKRVGDTLVLGSKGGSPVAVRLAGTLRDSIFQSEIVLAEEDFLKAFPLEQGFRMFLVDAPAELQQQVAGVMEERLKDFGLDLQPAGDRLAAFHKVENAYLSTFQTLGALGLLLGTVGLGAVLLRNVWERRKELALLRAVGYQPAHLATLVLAENTLLLVCGLVSGTLCALLAILPALIQRSQTLPLGAMGGMLLAVFLTGIMASLLAVRSALRTPLLPSLRSE
ncbi:MAG: ABC transporter permease [Bryobacteraceae bacterium]|nr:ABC transporter permease [Bryobacteraceae bacterium]MDW8378256.1 ABC transporter permease [Bryobacterales bacterium]